MRLPVPDRIEVDVAAGVKVLVVSDLHLTATATPASTSAADRLADALGTWAGPGVVVLAGDILELLTAGPVEPAAALAPYGDLAGAARTFAGGDGRRLLYLVGNHDGRLAWDEDAVVLVAEAFGATLALATDLRIETAVGWRRVRVEHGHRFDPANAFTDPRDPLDTPIGHHVAAELLPPLARLGGALHGVEHLDEPTALPRMVASRVLYRRVAPWLWLLLLPPFLAGAAGGLWAEAALLEGSVLALLVGMAGGLAVIAGRTWSAVSCPLSRRGWAQNDAARAAARELGEDGYAGLVTGHTHHPELAIAGEAFYANAGCCTEVVQQRPTRRGFPSVWGADRQLSWVELEGGADVTARLVHGRQSLAGTRLERLVCHRSAIDTPPQVVASLADGTPWPAPLDLTRSHRRARRVGAVAIGLVGLLDLVSALSPPLADRLILLRRLMPFGVPQAATALVALTGLALMLLARGVRHGQRRAWRLSLALLLLSAGLHVVKGVDVEEALVALTVASYLALNRPGFSAGADRPSLRRGLLALSAGPVLVAAVAAVVVELFPSPGTRLPPGRALQATAGRLVGVTDIALPSRAGTFLTPTLLVTGLGLAVFGLWLLFRPVIAGRGPGQDLDRARAIVRQYGADTLAYFALRDDKEHFFFGESLVAYAICQGICLVSPDPIGPRSERSAVWSAFRRFADQHGWTVAVLGAGEDWLPVYRGGGMRDLYVGDEGVVDVQSFNLHGGRFKGLRQAVNRIANYGYRIEFHDPSNLDPVLQQALCHVMTQSRRGDVERGFSMTLGRVFHPDDRGLLLAIAFGPDGRAAAFGQFVPAPGIDGYSLDLMRRSDGDHPNGLTDFVVVKTIEHLRDRGMLGLGLNFATMRAVLAGELGDGATQRAQRWVLRRLSGSMQIESLWRYNAKFAPAWQPRFAVYDAAENILPAALAVAKAESFWELPVIGRFLVPKVDAARTPSKHAEKVTDKTASTTAHP